MEYCLADVQFEIIETMVVLASHCTAQLMDDWQNEAVEAV